MDAVSVWHANLTKCSDLRNQTSDARTANIFLTSDKFYEVLLKYVRAENAPGSI